MTCVPITIKPQFQCSTRTQTKQKDQFTVENLDWVAWFILFYTGSNIATFAKKVKYDAAISNRGCIYYGITTDYDSSTVLNIHGEIIAMHLVQWVQAFARAVCILTVIWNSRGTWDNLHSLSPQTISGNCEMSWKCTEMKNCCKYCPHVYSMYEDTWRTARRNILSTLQLPSELLLFIDTQLIQLAIICKYDFWRVSDLKKFKYDFYPNFPNVKMGEISAGWNNIWDYSDVRNSFWTLS